MSEAHKRAYRHPKYKTSYRIKNWPEYEISLRLYSGNFYVKSFYMLGKIYEEKSWKGKAIEFYEKFLFLWKDSDPGIAEEEDVRKRLAELKRL